MLMTIYIVSEWDIDERRESGLSKSVSMSSPIATPVRAEDLRIPRLEPHVTRREVSLMGSSSVAHTNLQACRLV